MLDFDVLKARWGAIFGGISEYDTFRGTTIYTRADTINALYADAASQRIVVDNLYDRTVETDESFDGIVTYFEDMAKRTLSTMCVDNSVLPFDTSDVSCLTKMVTDALAQAETFQLPTVTIGGANSATGTPVTTLEGAPTGNGVIVGSILNPITGGTKIYAYDEIIQFTCSGDSYTSGLTAGNEIFSVISELSVPYTDAEWPKGSGRSTTYTSSLGSNSSLVQNSYFSSWDDTDINQPDDWTLVNLTTGTTITRSSDAYSEDYAVQLTAAILDAELKQAIANFTGVTNYVIGIRMKRPGVVTQGVITLSLRDIDGNILNDASGTPLSTTISLAGASGSYTLSYAVLPVPKAYSDPVYASIRVTTAMAGGESVLLDNFELKAMTELYAGGPTFALIPGDTGWAVGDRYTFTVATSAGKDTFVRYLDRTYQVASLGIYVPVSASPTISDAEIT